MAEPAVATERPDPLAELAPRPAAPLKPDVSTCSFEGCGRTTSVVIWFGCTAGEHAGPAGYCGAHLVFVQSYAGRRTCAQCSGNAEMKILKTEPWASYRES